MQSVTIELLVCAVGLALSVLGVLLEVHALDIVGAVVTAVGLGMILYRWSASRS